MKTSFFTVLLFAFFAFNSTLKLKTSDPADTDSANSTSLLPGTSPSTTDSANPASLLTGTSPSATVSASVSQDTPISNSPGLTEPLVTTATLPSTDNVVIGYSKGADEESSTIPDDLVAQPVGNREIIAAYFFQVNLCWKIISNMSDLMEFDDFANLLNTFANNNGLLPLYDNDLNQLWALFHPINNAGDIHEFQFKSVIFNVALGIVQPNQNIMDLFNGIHKATLFEIVAGENADLISTDTFIKTMLSIAADIYPPIDVDIQAAFNLFAAYDVNQDGYLDEDEFGNLLDDTFESFGSVVLSATRS